MNRVIRGMRSLVISGRMTNLPSVFSEVFAGACIGFSVVGQSSFSLSYLWGFPFLSGMFFYLSGMWGNDARDAAWDRRHYPERPIPSGMISRSVLSVCALLAWLLAFVCLPPQGMIVGCVLGLCIILYTAIHKSFAGSIFIMALCRVSLLWLGYVAVFSMSENGVWSSIPLLLWVASGVLFLYLVGLTYWARGEVRHKQRVRQVGLLLSSMPVWDILWVVALGMWIESLFPLLMLILARYLRYRGMRSS